MNEVSTIDVNVFEVHQQPSKENVLSIIDEYYKRGAVNDFSKKWEGWQCSLGDEADFIFEEIVKEEGKIRGHVISLSGSNEDNKSHPQSIIWEALDIISAATFDNLLPEDLPYLRKFLLTPAGKELEGWAEWEEYWESRHPVQK